MIRIFSPLTPALAGRRTCDTRDDFCASVSFMSAGVLLRRPAHTKTSCVGFRETQGWHDLLTLLEFLHSIRSSLFRQSEKVLAAWPPRCSTRPPKSYSFVKPNTPESPTRC